MGVLYGILGLIALIVIVWLWQKLMSKAGEAANRKIFNRTGHRRGQAAVQERLQFSVPGVAAAQLLDTILADLDLPTQAPVALIRRLIVQKRDNSNVIFSLGTRLFDSFKSLLSVADQDGGCQGAYEVYSWHLAEGIVMDWKEMELLTSRISGIVARLGGRSWVSAGKMTNENTEPETETEGLTDGQAQLEPVSVTVSAPRFCRECGERLTEGGEFCGYCGANVIAGA